MQLHDAILFSNLSIAIPMKTGLLWCLVWFWYYSFFSFVESQEMVGDYLDLGFYSVRSPDISIPSENKKTKRIIEIKVRGICFMNQPMKFREIYSYAY